MCIFVNENNLKDGGSVRTGRKSMDWGASKKTAFVVILWIFFITLIRTAWISDDAAITLRTVLNFTHGYGLTFNIDERVQAYTHPLWFLLISGLSFALGNVYFATFAASIIISFLVLWLFFSFFSKNYLATLVAGIALVLSKAFIDYSTSGLENPLSHLLILLAILAADKAARPSRTDASPALFFGLCSLLYLSRPDLLLMLFPLATLVALSMRRDPKKLFKFGLIGASPALVWTLFSLFYYGFPFPNTAYAKLGAGIPVDARVVQGMTYVLHSVGKDPITPAVMALGIFLGLRSGRMHQALAAGIGLYVLYVISIGGDFMEGRFFTAPLLVAAVLIARTELKPGQLAPIAASVVLLGMMSIDSTILSDPGVSERRILSNGIADERAYYYQKHGLVTATRDTFRQPEWKVGSRSVQTTCGGLGFQAITSGPGTHYIDACGLADPLLARLPAQYNPQWRVGHFFRQLPTGYIDSFMQEENLLSDPATSEFWASIRAVTRGPLLNKKRLIEIFRFHFMRAKPDFSAYNSSLIAQFPAAHFIPITKLIETPELGGTDSMYFSREAEITLGVPSRVRSLNISLQNNGSYEVWAYAGGKWRSIARVTQSESGAMILEEVELPQALEHVDRLLIKASDEQKHRIGYVRVM